MALENAETVAIHLAEPVSFKGRFEARFPTANALIADYQESDHKAKTAGVAAGAIVTQAAAMMRAPTLALPFIESGAVAMTHNKPLAAIAVAPIYWG